VLVKQLPLISVVVPVLNERENISAVHSRVCAVFDGLRDRYDLEFVFTDNHSDDGTFDEIVRLAALDPRVRGFRFSRNFGFQRSILEGLRQARGAAAIEMDADLQDPPELIPEFLRLWEDGNAVVYGVRKKRPDQWHVALARRAFYRIVDGMSEDRLPLDAGDFRLVDRRVLDVLGNLDDAQPYLRGSIAAMGFDQIGVDYERDARRSGESKFSLGDLMALSIDGILNHSIMPLRIATFTGLIVSVLSLLSIIGYVVARFAFGWNWPAGFATTTALILLGIGLNALFLGIVGEYLGRIYRQVKRGPNTIVERTVEAAGPGGMPPRHGVPGKR
jgi:glycosyltransferase involved in cell wall biosynthesis